MSYMGGMVFITTFNNISVISGGSQFYWRRKSEYPVKITDLPPITNKLLSHNAVLSTPRHELYYFSGDRH
jgi:hypothetical protein